MAPTHWLASESSRARSDSVPVPAAPSSVHSLRLPQPQRLLFELTTDSLRLTLKPEPRRSGAHRRLVHGLAPSQPTIWEAATATLNFGTP
eukprot:2010374-Rhodomonas_salina.1